MGKLSSFISYLTKYFNNILHFCFIIFLFSVMMPKFMISVLKALFFFIPESISILFITTHLEANPILTIWAFLLLACLFLFVLKTFILELPDFSGKSFNFIFEVLFNFNIFAFFTLVSYCSLTGYRPKLDFLSSYSSPIQMFIFLAFVLLIIVIFLIFIYPILKNIYFNIKDKNFSSIINLLFLLVLSIVPFTILLRIVRILGLA